jgi:N6-adenosine-specific RNA methylase IME4
VEDVEGWITEPRKHLWYPTIVADPPWEQKAGTLRGREGWLDAHGASANLPYATMSVDEIAAVPVGEWARDDAHVYLWVTNKYLPRGFDVLEAWGFRYSTTIVWCKKPMGGGLGGKFGVSTEYVLHGTRGSLPAIGRVRGTWFQWKRPYDERGKPKHSSKPPEFLGLVEKVSPGPYLEVFARRRRQGWDVWGDEAPKAA